ncbi:hypothetical protein H0H93_000716 [Arthromyces matolae]|nr:hypothetical protein H0H93_000716 [Arthromyces matolae]
MSVPGLKWGDDDNEHAMVGRALTYLMLYYTFTTVVRWSVGVQLLSQSDDDTPQHHGNNEELDSVTSTSNPVDVQYQRGISRLHYLHQFSRFFFWINALMTPPLWAAFFSIVVTCVQPVQHILETHLSSIKGALAQAGDCCIPLTLVVLGAYFHVPSESQENQKYQGEQCDVRDSLQRGKIGIDVDGAEEGRQRWTETLRRLFGFEQAIMLPSDDNESLPSPFPPPPPHQYLNSACANEHIYTEEPTGEGNREPEQQSEGRVGQHMHEGEIKTICIAVLSRMIITPVVLMPLLVLSSKLGLHRVFEEYVYIFCRFPYRQA